MFAVTSVRTPPVVVLLLLAAAACGDSTGPSDDTFSGTYVMLGLIEESACSPAPWPAGAWSPGFPDVGTPVVAVWQVIRSGSSISVTAGAEGVPEEEVWRFTAQLAADLTFSIGPRTVIDGTVDTDAGTFDLILDETVSGSIQVQPTARITARHAHMFTFTRPASGIVFTTCSLAVTLTGTRAG